MVLIALRAYRLSKAKNVAAIMFNHQSCIVDCGSFSRAYHALEEGNLPLHAHHCLHPHRAVHQPDAGVGGVAVDAGLGNIVAQCGGDTSKAYTRQACQHAEGMTRAARRN